MESVLRSIEKARELGHKPRLHPNGFVQLDIEPNQRLHIWPVVSLPKPTIEGTIHDHTFSFTSHVLLGTLINTRFEAISEPSGQHRLFEIFPFLATGRQTPFVLNDESRYHMDPDQQIAIKAGNNYAFPAFEFHETNVEGFTATIITVGAIDKLRRARVAIPFPADPDPDFSRDCVPQEELWDIINSLQHMPVV